MRSRILLVGVVLFLASPCLRAQIPELSPTVKQFVRADTPKTVLTRVRIINGTGAAAVEDRNVVIEGGKITGIQRGPDVAAASGTTVLNLRGDWLNRGWQKCGCCGGQGQSVRPHQ
jgi:hypothetical protein